MQHSCETVRRQHLRDPLLVGPFAQTVRIVMPYVSDVSDVRDPMSGQQTRVP